VGSSFPASMLVVAKLDIDRQRPPALDQTFGNSGLIKLVADDTLTNPTGCVVSHRRQGHAATDCARVEAGYLPPLDPRHAGGGGAHRRTGFQLFTTWYDPPSQLGHLPGERDQRQQLRHSARVPVHRNLAQIAAESTRTST